MSMMDDNSMLSEPTGDVCLSSDMEMQMEESNDLNPSSNIFSISNELENHAQGEQSEKDGTSSKQVKKELYSGRDTSTEIEKLELEIKRLRILNNRLLKEREALGIRQQRKQKKFIVPMDDSDNAVSERK